MASATPDPAAPDLGSERVAAFLDALASGAPTPGGGAAAALAGALAAGLVAMVCRVTVSRGGDASLARAADEADEYRTRLLALGGDDAVAYGAVIASRRASPDAQAAALQRATEVPLAIATAACAVLGASARVAASARKSAIGDLRVAAALAWAALDGAAFTARLNLRDIPDGEFRRTSDRQLADVQAAGEGFFRDVSHAVAERTGPAA